MSTQHTQSVSAEQTAPACGLLSPRLGFQLVEACEVTPGLRVLDVAAGDGNAAIPAARNGADVVASDLFEEPLERGRQRAATEGLDLEWVQADAQQLPFEDGSFDVTVSSIGAMFAADHQKTADELCRVTRDGGTVGLLSWTPDGLFGGLLEAVAPFGPENATSPNPPSLWGREAHLENLFGSRVEFHTLERRTLEVAMFDQVVDLVRFLVERCSATKIAVEHVRETGREAEFDEALQAFAEAWENERGEARFEVGYLIAIGTVAVAAETGEAEGEQIAFEASSPNPCRAMNASGCGAQSARLTGSSSSARTRARNSAPSAP